VKRQRFISGYIEGYYGALLTFQQRNELLLTMNQCKNSHWLYAPKHDPNHRLHWKTPYSSEFISNYTAFSQKAHSLGISLISAISPGLHYDYSSEDDYAALCRKFESMTTCGSRSIALLMDDISLAGTSLALAGQNQITLLKKLQQTFKGVELFFCPTLYCTEISKKYVESPDYFSQFQNASLAEITFFWTGPYVVSPSVDTTDARRAQQHFAAPVCYWDNFYANDFFPARIGIFPFVNRPALLAEHCSGVMINPTGLPHTDALLLKIYSGWLKHGYCSQEHFAACLKEAGVPDDFLHVVPYLGFSETPKQISPDSARELLAILNRLLFGAWLSPLHTEWFGLLQALRIHLQFALDNTTPHWRHTHRFAVTVS